VSREIRENILTFVILFDNFDDCSLVESQILWFLQGEGCEELAAVRRMSRWGHGMVMEVVEGMSNDEKSTSLLRL